ncbi:threonine synthase [Emticicia oligotrophica DSM 17448]|uniref:Threonine synthase n=1 Tax=Emticicia oligotrophica (strain DSM 17448 / CIP 109782 / MTCC 6937 / GPTSA100-15) TaxID=929562 RepID=A0ABN4APF6_EMTOG|nr:threonine synthase [Emticicia oligotrophica]AFK04258.1 threonine synthase [Emticicia oligotrophica DSM 17448]
MKLYSTNHQSPDVDLAEAVFRGLPPDNGLYMPTEFKPLPSSFWDNVQNLSLQEIAFEIAHALIGEDVPTEDLRQLINRAIDFEAPIVKVEENTYCLELFHGPSMAFKDFGARFMAALMSYFLQKSQKQIHILVATSGDTGGAVAQGFYKTPNIDVTILYPSGKVSDIQEKQLTTLGENVRALEVSGTFDDCQKLVKQAFLDKDLTSKFDLASANSINIARLIPQAFYYVSTYAQLKKSGADLPVVISVPSGNFGNLSAGIIAWRLGMPIKKFIATTNVNNVVPTYLESGIYEPISPSLSTISNAMDVGNPSNFPRMKALLDNDLEKMKELVAGYYYNDDATRAAMKDVYERTGYVMCPHTAVAYLGLKSYTNTLNEPVSGVFLSTAHYAKFLDVVEEVVGKQDIPQRLSDLLSLEKQATPISTNFADFKAWLMENL